MRSTTIQAIAAAVTTLLILFAMHVQAQPSEPQAATAPPMVAEVTEDTPAEIEPVVSVEEAETLTAEQEETILSEDERIEAALVANGYYRNDIPLTYLEQDYLHTAADEFGVDYYLMVALIERETDFRNIYGDGGSAYGYCQVWPKWWGDLMAEIGANDLTHPYDNFRTAAAILNHLRAEYGNIENALTYYNTGHPGESEYASDILTNAEKWREG